MAVLPEYLTEQTEEAIRQRILDTLPDDLDKAEGSYIWDAVSPMAIELALAAMWAQEFRYDYFWRLPRPALRGARPGQA